MLAEHADSALFMSGDLKNNSRSMAGTSGYGRSVSNAPTLMELGNIIGQKQIGGLLIIKVEENILPVVYIDTLSVIIPQSLVVIQKTDWCYGC